MMGEAASRGGDMVSANHYLKRAVQNTPRTAGYWSNSAGPMSLSATQDLGAQTSLFLAYLRIREFDKALGVAEQAAKSQPKNPAGLDMEAAVYFIKGDREAARAALLEAHEMRRSDVDANSNLAKLALADGKMDQAREYYLDILKDNPKSAQTYRDLAALETQTGHPDEAEAYLIKGFEANPDDPLAAAAMALHRLAQGKYQAALQWLRRS